jgi:DNA-binding Xre family transcriptional regulator
MAHSNKKILDLVIVKYKDFTWHPYLNNTTNRYSKFQLWVNSFFSQKFAEKHRNRFGLFNGVLCMAYKPLLISFEFASFVKLMPVRNKDQFAITLGQRIREMRIRKNLSIGQLALESGLDYTQLSRIELGKINTRVFTLYQISKALEVPLDVILKDI